MNNKFLIILFAIVVLITVGVYVFVKKPAFIITPESMVTNFEECLEEENPAMESYPRKCISLSGESFTEDIGDVLEKMSLIMVDSPFPNKIITSPLEITGVARGFWFFEADFLIKLIDSNGKLLGTAIAQAKTDWMTEEFVQFEATLIFDDSEATGGNIFFIKDNPSDISENDDELRIPVKF